MMMRFGLRCTKEQGFVEHSFDADNFKEVLVGIEMFLRGCGYEVDGNLTVIPSDDTTIIKKEEINALAELLQE